MSSPQISWDSEPQQIKWDDERPDFAKNPPSAAGPHLPEAGPISRAATAFATKAGDMMPIGMLSGPGGTLPSLPIPSAEMIPGVSEYKRAKSGDIAGAIGEGAADIGAMIALDKATGAGKAVVPPAVRGVGRALESPAAAPAIGAAAGELVGHPWLGAGAGRYLLRTPLKKLGGKLSEFGRGLPEPPGGPFRDVPEPVPDPFREAPQLPAPSEQAKPIHLDIGESETPKISPPTEGPVGIQNSPHTLSGEGALRQVLTGQDNKALLQIAKSRGLNVTQEAQLKPGVADTRIVGKIIDSFSPEELDEIRSKYIENTRMGRSVGDIGAEAYKTKSLQTYFPDLKISQARLGRTAKAVENVRTAKIATPSGTNEGDLTGILTRSVEQVKRQKNKVGQ